MTSDSHVGSVRRGFRELTLIVIGVLIALWAENAREGISERRLEQDYLIRLAGDLTRDTAALTEAMEASERRGRALETVLAAMDHGERPAEPSKIVQATEEAWFFSYPSFSRSAIDDLMSTGNLRLIRSGMIKSALSDYYTSIERGMQFRDIFVTSQQELSQLTPTLLTLGQRYSTFPEIDFPDSGPTPWWEADPDVTPAEADAVLAALVSRPEIRPLYADMARTQARHFIRLAQIKEAAIGVLHLLPDADDR